MIGQRVVESCVTVTWRLTHLSDAWPPRPEHRLSHLTYALSTVGACSVSYRSQPTSFAHRPMFYHSTVHCHPSYTAANRQTVPADRRSLLPLGQQMIVDQLAAIVRIRAPQEERKLRTRSWTWSAQQPNYVPTMIPTQPHELVQEHRSFRSSRLLAGAATLRADIRTEIVTPYPLPSFTP